MIFICVRGSAWNGFFNILRFKELKKEVSPKWWWVNVHWHTNILFEKTKRHSIDKSLFSEVSSSSSLRSLIDRCYREGNAFCDFGFEDKLDKEFRRSLCGMVLYKVLNSNVEIDLAFFLTLILFSLVVIGKKFVQPSISYGLNKRNFCFENFLQI